MMNDNLIIHGTFATAAAAATLEFYSLGVPDGGYIKIEPVDVEKRAGDHWEPAAVTRDVSGATGWDRPSYRVVAEVITAMYGPHATVIGLIVVEGAGFRVVWQDM